MASLFEWNGDKIIQKLKQAEKTGLFVTGTRICLTARNTVRIDTSALQSSIKPQTEEAIPTGDGFSLEIGSDNDLVEYALMQEIGKASGPYSFTPYIRPSVDSEAGHLGEDIKSSYGD